MHEVKLLVIY